MARPGFHSVFVLITVFTFTQLDMVLSGDVHAVYDAWYEENSTHDFAVRITYESDLNADIYITINIFYNAESPSAESFFTQQLKPPLLKSLVDCKKNVKLNFFPCSTSNLKSNLNHSCFMNAVKGDEGKVGNYALCAYSGKTLDQCDKEAGQDAEAINRCVNSGPETCKSNADEFKTAQDKKGNRKMPASVFTDFKGAVNGVLSFTSVTCNLG